MQLYFVQVGGDADRYFIVLAENSEAACTVARTLLNDDWPVTLAATPTGRGAHTVGRRFRGPQFDATCTPTYRCVAYDWRTGWWMRNETTGELRDISERAIGRTYHEIRETA